MSRTLSISGKIFEHALDAIVSAFTSCGVLVATTYSRISSHTRKSLVWNPANPKFQHNIAISVFPKMEHSPVWAMTRGFSSSLTTKERRGHSKDFNKMDVHEIMAPIRQSIIMHYKCLSWLFGTTVSWSWFLELDVTNACGYHSPFIVSDDVTHLHLPSRNHANRKQCLVMQPLLFFPLVQWITNWLQQLIVKGYNNQSNTKETHTITCPWQSPSDTTHILFTV